MNPSQLYKVILDHMNEAVYVRDLDMKIAYMNPAAQRVSGRTFEEVRRGGHRCFEIFGDEGRTCHQRFPGDKPFEPDVPLEYYEGKVQTRTGHVLNMRVSVTPLYEEGRKFGTLFIMKNITGLREKAELERRIAERTAELAAAHQSLEQDIQKRQRMEDALRQSQQLLENIVENIPLAVFVKDPQDEFRIRIWNKGAESIFGIPRDEMIGRNAHDFWPKEQADFYLACDRKTIEDRIPQEIHEEPSVHRKHGEISLHTRKLPLYNEQGQPTLLLALSEDITERKRKELEQAQHQLLMTLMLNTGPGCIKRVAADGTLLHMNPAGLAAIEADREEEALGRSVFDLIAPGHRQAFEEMHRAVLNGTRQTLQFEVIGLKGTRRWMESYAAPFRNPITDQIEHLAVTHDITERKKSEGKIDQLLRQNQLILHSAGEGIYGLDTKGFTTFVNPTAAKMLGYEPDDLIGIPMHAAIHHTKPDGSAYPAEECPMYAAFKDGLVHHIDTEVFWRKDGTSFPVDYSSTPIRDEHGNLVGSVVTFSDRTERQRVTDALQQSEARYRSVVEDMPGLLCRFQPGGILEFVNEAYARYVGQKPEDLIGKSFLQLIPEKDRARVKAALDALSPESPVMTHEHPVITAGGEVRWYRWTNRLLVDDAGLFVAYQAFGMDITELRHLEEQVRQRQKLEAIGTLAAGIAHDFNNILTAIFGFGELASSKLPETHTARRDIDEIVAAGKRAKALVQQILMFCHETEPHWEQLDLRMIVRETLGFLRASIPSTIDISQDLDPTPIVVKGDATQLSQIILNLGTNAEYAMRSHGGQLQVTLQSVELDPGFVQLYPPLHPGWYARLMIRDTGTGIAPDILSKIFDPFFTTKEVHEGTGLGLSVAHGIVVAHGGITRVDSEVGHGTTFTIYLPQVTLPCEEKKLPAPQEQRPAFTGKILFVDDEEFLVRFARELLGRLGFEVVAFTEPAQALAAFRAEPENFSVVITDYTMPHMTGYEVARELLAIRPTLPVILCTGYSHVMNTEKARSLGIRDFLLKPFRKDELLSALHAAVNREKEVET